MDLWIRSQDRERLTKSTGFHIEANINYYNNKPTDFDVYALNSIKFIKIGTYKTKERALEILDEIQKMDFGNNPNVKLTTYGYVYEMPNE